MGSRILVVTGWSNAGKTTFTRWLEATHGFDRVDIDENEIDTKGLGELWAKVEQGNATAFRDKLLGRPKHTVLDCPYRPPYGFPVVLSLQAAKVPVWWFDADPDAAQKSFSVRAQGDLRNREQGNQANFSRLRADIEHWNAVILRIYGRRILRTLNTDGSRLTNAQIWKAICTGERWKPWWLRWLRC